MVKSVCRKIAQFALLVGVGSLAFAPVASAIRESPTRASTGYTVVLDCAGKKFTADCDDTGKFVFTDVPAGACAVSLISSAPQLSPPEEAAAAGKTGVVSPRDAASGLPTGKRMHKPMLKVTFDGEEAFEKTMAEDSWTDGSASVVMKEGKYTKTGHVTLMK